MSGALPEIAPLPAHGGDRTEQVDNVNLTEGGNSQAYLLRRQVSNSLGCDNVTAKSPHRGELNSEAQHGSVLLHHLPGEGSQDQGADRTLEVKVFRNTLK